jgi:two-component system sensor histidine kinase PilS (NtrC family)
VSAPSLDLHVRLRVFAWARIAVVACLGCVGPWAPPVFVPTASVGLLLAVLLLVLASSGVLLVLGPEPRPRAFAWWLCVLDATLVTAVVSATGGARSILVCLYVPLVTAACVLLSRRGALVIAAVSSGFYAAFVFVRSVVPVAAFGGPGDGTLTLEVLAVLVNTGTLVIVACVAGDLAERFLSSQRTLASERRILGDLQAFSDVIFRSVKTGLVALDGAHRITAFNPAAETLTGVSAATARGARWADVFGAGLSLGEVEAALRGEPTASLRHEIELHRTDGAVVPVRVTASVLEAGDGTRLGWVAACEDLSSVRAMEARMRQADRLATIGRMAANIAHEVRNPVASLSGAVEALTRPDVQAETRGRLTEIVLRESERLSEIIHDFLEYARPAPLLVEKIDAASVLDDVLSTLGPRLSSKGVTIVRIFPAPLPLEADRDRLRQIVWTLCLNALGAMPAGGELRVEGRARAGMIEITVADTGEGIASHDLAHVFEPFFAHRHDATGLGLAVVHRVVQQHRGDVTVRSQRGRGAEFTLRFPERHA